MGPLVVEPSTRDDRPLALVALLAAVLAAAVAITPSRAWLDATLFGYLRAQADPLAGGASPSYTPLSLAVWAILGAALAWAAFEIVFTRLRVPVDLQLVAALAPYLVFGPLFHALLAADALPSGSLVAYLAAEPLVYLTTATLALAGFAVGALVGRPAWGAAALGALALVPLLALAAPIVRPESLGLAAFLVALAATSAILVGIPFHRWRRRESLPVVLGVVGAHALDGATTWMVLRNPFNLPFDTFSEKNPLSDALVSLSNGWPYFAVKLALPLVLLYFIRVDEGQERLHRFLLLAVFVLGYGPGMANLLQVVLG